MGQIRDWDYLDDEEVHSHRVRSRVHTTLRFLDEAIQAIDEGTPKPKEEANLPDE